ncbi:MAG: hypothetical protein IKD78_03070 [Bacteroidales bacterium]|nr:hypothetical protein [Bacteroidales bacterium]
MKKKKNNFLNRHVKVIFPVEDWIYAGQYETWQPRAFLDEGHLYSFRRFLAAICFHGG